ncbi:MAG: septum formation initiator family protein [Rhodospirillaceae bacterium]|nr:septum formation initiator family protein [Rhodospirillaceae bacterium]
MGFFFEIKRRAGQIIGPVAGITMVVYFAYHSIQGERGFIVMGKLERQVVELDTELSALREKRTKIENRVSLLKPDNLDPDMLEERARIVLGYTQDNEIILLEAKPDNQTELASMLGIPMPKRKPVRELATAR